MSRDPAWWPEGAAGERALADRHQSDAELERLRGFIPEDKLARLLRRLADRAGEILLDKDSAHVELHLGFHGGRFSRARFDADERLA